MFFYGFKDELEKISSKLTEQEKARFAVSNGEKKKKKGFIRKAGPGVGAIAGLAGSLALKKPLLTGIGTGATVGWLPDVIMSLKEAIKERKGE